MKPYFIYNNIDSRDMGILVNELPPIIKAPRDINKIIIPGRDGFLTEDFQTYGGTVKSCECTILDITQVDQVLAWLDGSGEVIFSNQLDRKYQACIINQIPFNRIIRKWYKFIVIFDCQPFSLVINSPVITMTIPGTIVNPGNHPSKPTIKIYGNGAISLVVNGAPNYLVNVVGYVTINSDIVDCYKDSQLKNNDMTGPFPTLKVGSNVISWTGSVTSIQITPNSKFK